MASGPKTVALVDKDGNEYQAASPADITNLVYGAGYKVKANMTPDQAAAFLTEQGAAAADLAATNTVVTDTKGKGSDK